MLEVKMKRIYADISEDLFKGYSPSQKSEVVSYIK